ncbi:hypothetical protein [Novosphingobium album (ex Hu et al. 2023)]|uniref:Lipoprotein n=1 Tax=Novosphingobium album (ex Hu et al. 2023) TaxID=2930093 RepID=A0ABT0AZD2_9SPHN|nr:hypothetical protein [Novosphingobium album (ex Hu et al. 2023)]MCJ2178162.1 hypothetical protein [Novosphingobium album (ex Hu et al. 2023)]
MKRPVILTCLAASVLSLSACYDGYGSRVTVSWSTYPYYGWYDGFYGPIYDGYWVNSIFYFRLTPQDRAFRAGDPQHFRRGDMRPTEPRFKRFEGTLRPPPQGTHMPRFEPPRDQPSRREDHRDPH